MAKTTVLHILVFFTFIVGVREIMAESQNKFHIHLVVLSSLASPHHSQRRNELFRRFIIDQHYKHQDNVDVSFYFTHTGPHASSAFLLVPAIKDFFQSRGGVPLLGNSWVLLCEPETRVDLPKLASVLTATHVNSSESVWWGGHALHDHEMSIRHHFSAEGSFHYPFVPAGVMLSAALVERIASVKVQSELSFRIDPAFEFSKWMEEELRAPPLHHLSQFCVVELASGECASWPTAYHWEQRCDPIVPRENILFAVKTCSKYFHDRIPHIKATWGREVLNVVYFAEVADPSIPTVDTGVENTEEGHCEKLLSILRYVHRMKQTSQWTSLQYVAILDDDTLVNEARLRRMVSCYTQDMDTLALGERYGYMNWMGDQGYAYITGGGGFVLSMSVLERVLESSSMGCPHASSPDDMVLGMWLHRLALHISHSHLFHQARPADYAPQLVNTSYAKAVSFHKFWMIHDVRRHYQLWLTNEPSKLDTQNQNEKSMRDEL